MTDLLDRDQEIQCISLLMLAMHNHIKSFESSLHRIIRCRYGGINNIHLFMLFADIQHNCAVGITDTIDIERHEKPCKIGN